MKLCVNRLEREGVYEPCDRVVDVRGDRLDSSRMNPPTTVVRYPALDVCWTPTRLDPLFKTYQGTAHAVPASAEAAHPARDAPTQSNTGCSRFSIPGFALDFRWLADLFVHACPRLHLRGFGGGGHVFGGLHNLNHLPTSPPSHWHMGSDACA